MAPLGWYWALVVWVYALAWFLIGDVAKLAAYRLLAARGRRRKGSDPAGLTPG